MGDSRPESIDSKERDRKRKKDKKEKKDKRDREDKKKRKKDKHRRRSYSRSRSRSYRRRRSSRDRRDRRRFSSPPREQIGIQQAANTLNSLQTQQPLVPQPGLPAQQQQQQQVNLGMEQIQNALNSQIQGGTEQLGAELDAQSLMTKLHMVKAQQDLATSKADRKIYVGNIPTHITTTILCEVLNAALKQMQVNMEPPGDSITCAWISPDQHYSFVEFRTPEEATRGLNALAQGDIKLYGQAIKLGRPKQYLQQTSAIETTSQMMPGMQPNDSYGDDQKLKNNKLLKQINPLGASCLFDGKTSETFSFRTIQNPTRVLVLINLFAEEELIIDEEFDDIYEDVKQEFSKFGNVLNLIFPRPSEGEQIDRAKGHGYVYCRYSTIDEARDARRGLHGRQYGSRTIDCLYLGEDQFNKDDYKVRIC